MPNAPTRGEVHVNQPLTTMSVAYLQSLEDVVSNKMFPDVPVKKQSDRYFVYTKEYWFQAGAAKRAPGTESAGGGFHVDNTPTFYCDKWSYHTDIDDDTRDNTDSPLDSDRDGMEFVLSNIVLKREKVWVSRFMQPGIWTGHKESGNPTDFTPPIKWDQDNAKIINDIDALKSEIKSRTGYRPNKIAMSDDVMTAIKNNARIVDLIKYTQEGSVTNAILARLLGVDELYNIETVINNAQEGQAGQLDFIVKNKFLLCYAAPSPSIRKPSAGYNFIWTGRPGSGAAGNVMKTFRMEHLESDRIEANMYFDLKVVGADLGVLGTGVLTT